MGKSIRNNTAKKAEESRKSKTKMNDKVEKPELHNKIETRIYYCQSCGKSYTKQRGNFPTTQSPLFKGNNFYVNMCKMCTVKWNNYFISVFANNEEKALEKMAMLFDWYYSDQIMAVTKKSNTCSDRVLVYPSKQNLPQYNRHEDKSPITYLDTIRDRESNVVISVEDVENLREEGVKIKSNSIKFWGFGLTPEDYDFLNNQLSDWKSKCVIEGKAREALVKDLCMLELQKAKALMENKVDIYSKLVDTYQKTLDRANLTPKQEDANDKASEKPIGVMIDMFENEQPIPEPLECFKDVDGIMKLINIYFIGHLCKMLGLKNKYSEMYEDEMSLYRVDVPDVDVLDSDDIYSNLLENNENVEIHDGDEYGT